MKSGSWSNDASSVLLYEMLRQVAVIKEMSGGGQLWTKFHRQRDVDAQIMLR